MRVEEKDGGVLISDVSWFDADKIFDCGQCFRFAKTDEATWRGMAGSRPICVTTLPDGVFLFPCTTMQFAEYWRRYFDLDRDYAAITKDLCRKDAHLADAARYCHGLRLLRQEKFETLISFIVSANNNIVRIRGILSRLCESYGEKIETPWGEEYAFPTAAALADAELKDLRALGLGYRDSYVKRTAQRAAEDAGLLEQIAALDFRQAERALCEFPGVGKKVADCVALFSMDCREAFPKDVWIRRTAREVYHMDACALEASFGKEAGFAQQMLFYAARIKQEKIKTQWMLKGETVQ